MNPRDLFAMCRQNLLRRKGRTILTTLGVMIGCTAIIIMVSIGVGSSESLEVMLQEMGDLTMIEVYGYGQTELNDDVLDQMRATPGVVAATPKQYCDFGFQLFAGRDQRYRQQWSTTYGMDAAALDDIGYTLLEGEFPSSDKKAINVIVGQYFAYTFEDTKRPQGQNMIDRYIYDEEGNLDEENIPDPYFNAMTTPLTMEIYIDENKTITKELRIVGVMKEDYGRGYETSEGIIMDIGVMQELSREIAQARGELVKKGESAKYDNVMVKVSAVRFR
ncbi:MAG: ABC transporter permease [Butyricicoccus sp.]|nr:ABC transporter permease [Butyricicoccus sp.]